MNEPKNETINEKLTPAFLMFLSYMTVAAIPFYLLTLIIVFLKRLFTSPKRIFEKTNPYQLKPTTSIFKETLDIMVPNKLIK